MACIAEGFLGLQDYLTMIGAPNKQLWKYLYIGYFVLLLIFFLCKPLIEREVGPFLSGKFPPGGSLEASRKGTREFLSDGSVMDEPTKHMTMQNFLRICKEGAEWCIIDSLIFNLSEYIEIHPGDEKMIRQAIGTDATALFEGKTDDSHHIHSRYATNRLTSLAVGMLQVDDDATGRAEEGEAGYTAPPRARGRSTSIYSTMLSRVNSGELPVQKAKVGAGEVLRPALVMDKLTVTSPEAAYVVRKFVLFVNQNEPFNLVPGDAIIIELKNAEGKAISRPYTPMPSPLPGQLVIFVKIFPDGMLTSLLDKSRGGAGGLEGSTIFIRGPLLYTLCLVDPLNPFGFGCFVNVAMFIYHHVVHSERDPDTEALQTHMTLIWATRSEEDIYFQAEPRELEEDCAGSLKVVHVLSAPSERWDGESGGIEAPLVAPVLDGFLGRLMESASESPPYTRTCVVLCGAPESKVAAANVSRWGVYRILRGWTPDSDCNRFRWAKSGTISIAANEQGLSRSPDLSAIIIHHPEN
ncbi:hypothetical protein BDK51DRAFT_34670 [Blyttiomyces helicus]|uniref:Cytochrome b5 heme-binding domain-containing protein n=1 Tax=Blyttiomyces helicus TaxID=388810 RepID=A0A4P9WKX0_9FUNG|nr:hypothetical protein BDK51DRAFT_34670 [Blyttiomyces helicus]|eukprot:RKO92228.1 hypothetical protein BDK51DRAFT_34670 [Blyttiomyces helicus]